MREPGRPTRPLTVLAAAIALMIGLLIAAPAAQATTKAKPSTATTTTAVPNGIVVKVASGHSVNEVTAAYPVTVLSALLTSRGIYLMKPTNASDRANTSAITTLANKIATSRVVVYAEPDYATTLISTRYRSWPEGPPTPTTGGSAPGSTNRRVPA